MAHFARIQNDTVVQVIVIPNDKEERALDFIAELGLEGEWIQTSFNANIRTRFAGLGDAYNRKLDRFEPPKIFESWLWNEKSYSWEAPTPIPEDDKNYRWDEDSLSWVAVEADSTKAE